MSNKKDGFTYEELIDEILEASISEQLPKENVALLLVAITRAWIGQ